MKIGVIGGGTVGRAIARCYLEFVEEVRVYDVIPEKGTHHLHETVCDSDLVFICLPTPQHAMGNGADVSAIWELFKHFGGLLHNRNFVLKSTVPVHTTQKLASEYGLVNLVHSPEFLTARCAETDSIIPSMNVIGLPHYPQSSRCATLLLSLYRKRFPGIEPMIMGSDDSEALKLMINSWAAIKVATFNEFYQYVHNSGLNWGLIRRAMMADGRISPFWTRVPGPDGELGFGGACLPKDLADFIDCIESTPGLEAKMCRAAQDRNLRDRSTKL